MPDHSKLQDIREFVARLNEMDTDDMDSEWWQDTAYSLLDDLNWLIGELDRNGDL